MKIPNTTTDYQTSLDILREQRQIRRERFFSSPGLIMGLTVFILIVMAAIIIPAVANVDPNAMAIADRLKGPSLKHPFGTDEFGRDLMIRVLYGARVSLLAGGTVALLSCALGTVIGIYASYFKILDHILMRICEGLIAIPGVLLAIALMAALGASNLNVIIALTIVYTPSVARIVRSSALGTALCGGSQGSGGGQRAHSPETDSAGRNFSPDGSGVIHFCAGNHFRGVFELPGSRYPCSGRKLGQHIAGKQAGTPESAVDRHISGAGSGALRAQPESFGGWTAGLP